MQKYSIYLTSLAVLLYACYNSNYFPLTQLFCQLLGHSGLHSYAFYQGPAKMQNLFLGANVFMSGFGGHSMSL